VQVFDNTNSMVMGVLLVLIYVTIWTMQMKYRELLFAIALGFTMPSVAQNIVYACQFTNSSGLMSKNGNWQSATFNLQDPFFLVENNGRLGQE